MRLLSAIIFVCSAMLLVSGNAETSEKVDPEPDPTTAPPNTTTKPITTISPPTTKNITTPPTTSTSTTQKPTSTSSTTAKPTTTTEKTNTTTAAPITTPAPPSPPPPTPAPEPKPGRWIVNGTNQTCIIVRMAVQFNITYMTADNKTVHEMATLPSDNSTTATGICGAIEQVMYLNWKPVGADSNDSMVLHFVKNGTSYYSLHHIEAYITPKQLPRFQYNKTVMMIHNASEYKTELSNSYRCMRLQTFDMSTNATGTTGSVRISNLQFQAFKSDKSPAFGYAEDCAFDTPDVVPIAVGCALIALVVIVLAAYLVGRRRNQSRGYVSM